MTDGSPRARETRLGVGPCSRGSLQPECGRVDAVSLPCGEWTVVEQVPEVRAAPTAPNLGPDHAVGRVGGELKARLARRLGEARPPRAGIELRVGAEQLGPARPALVDAFVLRVDVLA